MKHAVLKSLSSLAAAALVCMNLHVCSESAVC